MHPLEIERFELLTKTEVSIVSALAESGPGAFRQEYPCCGMEQIAMVIGRWSEKALLRRSIRVHEC
ncbi:MAG: hypothetical protein WBP54_09270 [Pelodictyon phaeoclathratiforme]